LRGVHGTFPEFHSSADNLDLVKPEALDRSYAVPATLLYLSDKNCTYQRVVVEVSHS